MLLVWCDRASLLLLRALVKMRMTTREATEQSVKMSRRKWGSMGLCSEVSVEEDSELEADGRADFCLHIWSMVRALHVLKTLVENKKVLSGSCILIDSL